MMVGGFSQDREPDDEVRNLAQEIKPHAEQHVNRTFNNWEVVKFRSQVVAGTNFNLKISVGDGEYVHVRVFRSLPYAGSTLEVKDVRAGQSLETPLA